MKFILSIYCVLWGISAWAQTGTIKGTIRDAQSDLEIIGATVRVLTDNSSNGAVTDINGYFILEEVPLGRHDIMIQYLGYENYIAPQVEVTVGKDVVLNVAISESITQLDEIVVTGETSKDRANNELAVISARQFSLEEVTRYAGGRADVGRLAANFAGVSAPDDSRNDIVIRGNSPTGVLWRLEGIPIPNPNHFSTLGTTGGPVSALNPNILTNSDFLTGAFPAEYGDALAGEFDLGFRKGNRDEMEYTFQVGAFSGLEGMVEGPLNDQGASFLRT